MSQLTRTSINIIPPGLAVQTLTGNTGGPVGPDGANNINVVGDGTTIEINGNAGTNTLTATVAPIFAATYTTDDANFATPSAYNLNVFGGNNIFTSSSGDTVTIDVNGTTNHSLLVGNATGSINSLGVATNGQLPIGSTGADPVLSTLTAGTGVSITNGAGSITIGASGTSTLNYTNVNTSPYVVTATDTYLGVDSSGGAIQINLPNAPAIGRVFYIKDRTATADTNNITVTTVGGVVNIDGATTFVMNTEYESINVLFDGTTYQIF